MHTDAYLKGLLVRWERYKADALGNLDDEHFLASCVGPLVEELLSIRKAMAQQGTRYGVHKQELKAHRAEVGRLREARTHLEMSYADLQRAYVALQEERSGITQSLLNAALERIVELERENERFRQQTGE